MQQVFGTLLHQRTKNAMGIPPQVVMKWTGHSGYKAMSPYIDVADELKASQMKKFNDL